MCLDNHDNKLKYVIKFVSKIVVLDNGCWEWQGPPVGPKEDGKSSRYGHFYYTNILGEKVVMKAHRYSYCLAHKLDCIPEGLQVNHTCHYGMCCNPEHLYLGTQQDNVNDIFARGLSVGVKPIDRDSDEWKQRAAAYKERVRQYQKRYLSIEKNKERRNELARKYLKENKERINQRQRELYARNHVREDKYRSEHQERIRGYQRKYYLKKKAEKEQGEAKI